MLKFAVENLDGVDEADRRHYTKTEAGGYELAVEDHGLKTARDKERDEKKEAKAKLAATETTLAETKEALRLAQEAGARDSVDVQALEAGWKKKLSDELSAKDVALAARDAEYKPQIEKLRGNLQRVLIENAATGIASAIAMPGYAAVLLPHVKRRLAIGERDGELTSIVLDEAGKPTDLSLSELQSQIHNQKEFAPLVVGSKGSGGGAGGATQRGGSANANTLTRDRYDALSLPDREAFIAHGGRVQ